MVDKSFPVSYVGAPGENSIRAVDRSGALYYFNGTRWVYLHENFTLRLSILDSPPLSSRKSHFRSCQMIAQSVLAKNGQVKPRLRGIKAWITYQTFRM